MSLRGLLGFLLEIDFIAAGAQRGGGGMLQPFDGLGLLLVDVDQVLIQDAENAIEAAVNFLDAFMFARFLDDACHTGVDNRGGSAGLRDQ